MLFLHGGIRCWVATSTEYGPDQAYWVQIPTGCLSGDTVLACSSMVEQAVDNRPMKVQFFPGQPSLTAHR